jgi:branched-chain amino acid transport system ATP-binding protein
VNAGWCTSSKAIACSPSSACYDNLLLAGYGMPRRAAARGRGGAGVLSRDRRQAPRRAVTLSGGQQQMLAVAQGLVRRRASDARRAVGRPVAGAGRSRAGRRAQLRDAGTAVLLVEQLIEKALKLADRVYALARGSIVLEARTSEDDLPNRLEHAYFGQDVSAHRSLHSWGRATPVARLVDHTAHDAHWSGASQQ